MSCRFTIFALICALQLLLARTATPLETGNDVGSDSLSGTKDGEQNLKVVGSHYITTGPCTANDNAIQRYGTRMVTSPTLLAVSGDDGQADVQCIVQSCAYSSDLMFLWDGEISTSGRLSAAHRNRSNTPSTTEVTERKRPLAVMRNSVPREAAHQSRPPNSLQTAAVSPASHSSRKIEVGMGGKSTRQRRLLVAQKTPETDLSPLMEGTRGEKSPQEWEDEGSLLRGNADPRELDLGEPDADNVVVPMCERGGWTPESAGPVQLAIKGNLVVFGAAGCAELHLLDSNMEWQHVASLPRSLQVSAVLRTEVGGKEVLPPLRADLFAQQVAVDESVLAVTGALATPGVPNVVVMYVQLGGMWEQVDVVQCREAVGCACQDASRRSCFGSALAVSDSLLAVGNPANGSVLLCAREVVGPPGRGLELRWSVRKVLTSSWAVSHGSSMFGAALAMSASFLVIGSPSPEAAGAVVISLSRNATAAHPLGDVVFDSHSACCEKALACCHSASVGVSVAVGESEKTGYSRLATVAIGDPNNIQVHIASCNAAQLDRSDPEKPPCELTAVVLPGYDRDTDKWRRESQFAQSVGVGGYQAILVADAGQDCQYLAAGEGCGVVCEVPACSPGHCLMYDFSTDTDFCQKCTKPQECPGGIQSCEKMTNNTLWAMALSFFFFMLLFVCLYALSAWARGATALEILSEVCCCGLLRYVAGLQVVRTSFPDLEQALLGASGGGNGGGDREEDTDDEELDGYVPPALREAFRLRRQETVIGPGAVGRAGQENAEEDGIDEEEESSYGRGGEGDDQEDDGLEDREGAGISDRVESSQEQGEVSGHESGTKKEGNQNVSRDEDGEEEKTHSEGRSAQCPQPSEDLSPGDRMEAREEGEGGESNGQVENAEDAEEGVVGVSIAYFQCKICFERRIQTVLIPCGHEVLCRKCSRKIKTCPICRKTVKSAQSTVGVGE